MRFLLGWLAVCLLAARCLAAEWAPAWAQFRGPNGSGVAEGAQPPVEIGPEKHVKWKVAAPGGLSSPIVVGDLVVLTALDDGKLITIAYRRGDGSEAWRADAGAKELEPYHKVEGSPAASTPCSDGERVVSYFGSCGLRCYDLAGRELWRLEMPTVSTAGGFGSGVSPIVCDGLAVLVRDELQGAKIVAVEMATGKVRWETKRSAGVSYSTPVVWETAAGKQVAVAGHAKLIGYELATGREAWSCAGTPAGCCTSPVVAEGTLFFAGSSPGGSEDGKPAEMPAFAEMLKKLDKDSDGAISRGEGERAFGGFFDNQDANKDGKVTQEEWDTIMKFMAEGKNNGFALKAGGSGDIAGTHVLWNRTKGLPYVASALVYKGQYVMVKDGGIVTAYDVVSGEEIYQKRAVASGTYYASPVAANGQIYFTSLNDGVVSVIKGGVKAPEVVATNEPLGERVAATPAISGKTLYVRTAGWLYAFEGR